MQLNVVTQKNFKYKHTCMASECRDIRFTTDIFHGIWQRQRLQRRRRRQWWWKERTKKNWRKKIINTKRKQEWDKDTSLTYSNQKEAKLYYELTIDRIQELHFSMYKFQNETNGRKIVHVLLHCCCCFYCKKYIGLSCLVM